jgi:hypothetical protein
MRLNKTQSALPLSLLLLIPQGHRPYRGDSNLLYPAQTSSGQTFNTQQQDKAKKGLHLFCKDANGKLDGPGAHLLSYV